MGVTPRILVRAFKALDLKVAGKTYKYIANELKVSHTQAWDDVQVALNFMSGDRKDVIDRGRRLENAKLDALWSTAFANVAAAKPEKNGSIAMTDDLLKSLQLCLRISARRARLNGFDAPIMAPIDKEGNAVPPELKQTINFLTILNQQAPEAFDKFVEVTTAVNGNGTVGKKRLPAKTKTRRKKK